MVKNAHAPWKDEELLRQKYVVEDKSQAEIAEEFGCGRSTVSRALRGFGIDTSRLSDTAKELLNDRDELERLYIEEGKTTTEIAELADCGQKTVHTYLTNYGIPTRGVGGERHDAPFKDPETLRKRYLEEDTPAPELAEEWDCGLTTVYRHLYKFGIPSRHGGVHFKLNQHGYEYLGHSIDGKVHRVWVHRLLAVAEGKLEPADMFDFNTVVHHKDPEGRGRPGIPWDNRPDVLEVMGRAEHTSHHQNQTKA